MTATTRTILVPLDGSPLAQAALPYAEALARADGEVLCLLAVAEPEPDGTPGAVAGLRQHLAVATQTLADHGLSAAAVVMVGNPADAIFAAAAAPEVTMVVMATHGRSGIRRSVVGSVADTVMRQGTKPTLLVHPTDTGAVAIRLRRLMEPQNGADVALHLRRLMAPLDGSALAEAALPNTGALAQTLGATVVLVRVEPFPTAMLSAEGYVPDLSAVDAAVVAEAEAYLERVRRGLPAGVRVEVVVLRGGPAAMLAQFAQEEDVDLVVMATHGRGGFRRAVLGSTADHLVRTGVPTLLIRPALADATPPVVFAAADGTNVGAATPA